MTVRRRSSYLAEQEELREEWAGEVEREPEAAPGLGRELLETNRALLVAWDALSLAVCMPNLPGSFGPVASHEGGTEISFEEDTEAMEPVGPPVLREKIIRVSPGRSRMSRSSSRLGGGC